MSQKKKNNVLTSIKMIAFLLIIIAIARLAIIVLGNGRINSLEGYLYSFAAIATSNDATSSDATSSNATSCDATSSNATSCDATSSNATSSNVSFSNEALIQQQHLQEIQQLVEEEVEEPKLAETVTYKNAGLTQENLSQITESNDVKKIIIDANDHPSIALDLFKAIQNTDKQLVIVYDENELVFNGKNINSLRAIDATMDVDKLSNDEDISKLLSSDGVVINFANNGELPGVAKVRIKENEETKSNLTDSQVYAYYYDEINHNFTLVSENVKLSDDGYYEFAIDHNSKYILVNERIDERLIAGYIEPVEDNVVPEEETVSFLESHKTYICIIGICVLAIIIVAIIVAIDKKGIQKRKAETAQNNNKEDNNE